jgi:hypothetical protein
MRRASASFRSLFTPDACFGHAIQMPPGPTIFDRASMRRSTSASVHANRTIRLGVLRRGPDLDTLRYRPERARHEIVRRAGQREHGAHLDAAFLRPGRAR